MPMIGFIFYGFVAIIFTLLYICNKILSRNNSVYIENWILIASKLYICSLC